MASHTRVSFSGSEQKIDVIDQHYRNLKLSVNLYFSSANPQAELLFVGKSETELVEQLNDVSDENERLIALNILSALEAAFRIDYLQRCYKREKDNLSVAFREIHQQKGNKASLEDDIFDSWKEHGHVPDQVISDLKSAFKYRHWLAHGRYWTPKLGRRYDYFSVFSLGQLVINSFPLKGQ
ncbi:hypothetical protein [Candidatus Venteria ishoeyi]|uniref:Apea-like HEPN domain-containing protein n=1 Tax=Candidatus Venteria ishoeyi TaxID=1899563 RepID=A0A1H6F5Z5_9GAMM|nr:hypothetical protein [Candidatus Venteria ishoeyi]SEH04811.1 Uncharacterised protein [Candidatus Venteria ishoeyi]